MISANGLLATLQLSDSALPIGRFVHSHGLEAWIERNPEDESRLLGLVELAICESVAPLDGAALAHAHRASTLEALCGLDAMVTARKLTPAARTASRACGRRLALLAPELTDAAPLGAFADAVRAGRAEGNLAVMEGALARALGIGLQEAVLVELRGMAAGLLAAAVRLGRLPPMRAQVCLAALAPALERAAAYAVALDLEDLHATAPELEICAMVHARAATRFFQT